MKSLVCVLALGLCACGKARARDSARPGPPTQPSASGVTPASAPLGTLRESTFHFEHGPFGPTEVIALVPDDAPPSGRFPVLVAFHGRGESLKGPLLGARGWVDDYELGTTIRRLARPPLVEDDLLGLVTRERLTALNAGLSAHPYRGLIVLCPYLPDILRGSRAFEEGKRLSAFVVEELLPRAYRELPAIGTPASTGVDGVSLGGRAALLVGLLRPEAFGAVGALQPALDDEEAGRFADLAGLARKKNPGLRLRLLTSDGDYFLGPTRALDHALSSRGVAHQLDVVTGPHSYEFNRGPGGYEMLAFHDSVLR